MQLVSYRYEFSILIYRVIFWLHISADVYSKLLEKKTLSIAENMGSFFQLVIGKKDLNVWVGVVEV
jgi:hypothetical protein